MTVIGPIGLLIIAGGLFALIAVVGVVVWMVLASQRRD